MTSHHACLLQSLRLVERVHRTHTAWHDQIASGNQSVMRARTAEVSYSGACHAMRVWHQFSPDDTNLLLSPALPGQLQHHCFACGNAMTTDCMQCDTHVRYAAQCRLRCSDEAKYERPQPTELVEGMTIKPLAYVPLSLYYWCERPTVLAPINNDDGIRMQHGSLVGNAHHYDTRHTYISFNNVLVHCACDTHVSMIMASNVLLL